MCELPQWFTSDINTSTAGMLVVLFFSFYLNQIFHTVIYGIISITNSSP